MPQSIQPGDWEATIGQTTLQKLFTGVINPWTIHQFLDIITVVEGRVGIIHEMVSLGLHGPTLEKYLFHMLPKEQKLDSISCYDAIINIGAGEQAVWQALANFVMKGCDGLIILAEELKLIVEQHGWKAVDEFYAFDDPETLTSQVEALLQPCAV